MFRDLYEFLYFQVWNSSISNEYRDNVRCIMFRIGRSGRLLFTLCGRRITSHTTSYHGNVYHANNSNIKINSNCVNSFLVTDTGDINNVHDNHNLQCTCYVTGNTSSPSKTIQAQHDRAGICVSYPASMLCCGNGSTRQDGRMRQTQAATHGVWWIWYAI